MKLRILVAGGCHVVGYPIGEQFSFPSVARDTLALRGTEIEWRTMARVPIKHVKCLMDAVDTFIPDVVVLQLGNYETNITFRERFLKSLGLKTIKETGYTVSLPAEFPFRGKWTWRLKCAVKLGLDTLLGHPLVDSGEVRQKVSAMFGALAERGPRHVIVLGPLPCADPLYMRYRRRLARVFEEEASQRNFLYLKVTEAPIQSSNWFVDATHLNRWGQTHLAQVLTEALAPFFAERPRVATERKNKYVEV